jgi:hypothetical protein
MHADHERRAVFGSGFGHLVLGNRVIALSDP